MKKTKKKEKNRFEETYKKVKRMAEPDLNLDYIDDLPNNEDRVHILTPYAPDEPRPYGWHTE